MTRTTTTRPATRRKTTRARATVRVSPSRKNTISVSGFAGKLGSLLAEFPTLYEIWSKPSIDPAFREELMVAVARQNEAPYCNWAHRTWAASAGASEVELSKIERLDSRGLDRRQVGRRAVRSCTGSSGFRQRARRLAADHGPVLHGTRDQGH